MTTFVSYAVFWIAIDALGDERALIANAISFVMAVVFAFVVNKIFVFRSKSWAISTLKIETPAFLGVRLLSFAFEEAGIFVCIAVLRLHHYQFAGIDAIKLAKIVLSVAVVAVNYILGRTIFKAGKEK